jgi:hypothetical protein
LVLFVLSQASAVAAAKPHIITFGKWATVQCSSDSRSSSETEKLVTLKVIHEITDRSFVVRRAFRVNDSLLQESNSPPHWQWQRGGWLLVDRLTGHISSINLPEFDVFESSASWYRDYAAVAVSPMTAKRRTPSSSKLTAVSQF